MTQRAKWIKHDSLLGEIWQLTRPDGTHAATVWNEGTWHTWNHNGVGGENSKEATVEDAKIEAGLSAWQQGFIEPPKEDNTDEHICTECGEPYTVPEADLNIFLCPLCELKDIKEAHKAVVRGQCAPDELHCSCVSFLRTEITKLRSILKNVVNEYECAESDDLTVMWSSVRDAEAALEAGEPWERDG
jgi:hypothetical protein